jgi:hypothetical protein
MNALRFNISDYMNMREERWKSYAISLALLICLIVGMFCFPSLRQPKMSLIWLFVFLLPMLWPNLFIYLFFLPKTGPAVDAMYEAANGVLHLMQNEGVACRYRNTTVPLAGTTRDIHYIVCHTLETYVYSEKVSGGTLGEEWKEGTVRFPEAFLTRQGGNLFLDVGKCAIIQ